MYSLLVLSLMLIFHDTLIESVGTEGDNLVYVSYPKSFQDAREYCKVIFGTDLASIIDDDDRNEAVLLINQVSSTNDEAWVGLYSNSEQGSWRFVNTDECPSDSVFRCVEFWNYKLNENTRARPRCIGDSEGGTQCGYFDASENAVDNDIDCEEARPFLCEARVSPSSYTGQYVVANDIQDENGRNFNFMAAQARCESEFGTDLATILTEDDMDAVDAALPGDDQIAWIGLNDIRVEGQYEWIDGTPCVIQDNICSNLWNGPPVGFRDRDCMIYADRERWGSNSHIRMICANDFGSDGAGFPFRVLCNALN